MNNSLSEKKVYGFGIDYVMLGIIILIALVILGGLGIFFMF
jgi:hypothetical protein